MPIINKKNKIKCINGALVGNGKNALIENNISGCTATYKSEIIE